MNISPASAAVLTMMSEVVAQTPKPKTFRTAKNLDQVLARMILDALHDAGKGGVDIGALVMKQHEEDQQ